MENDIVARLRQSHRANCKCFGCESADELERLRARVAKLENELRLEAAFQNDEVQREAL